jgi:biotin carboxyl carrier protein
MYSEMNATVLAVDTTPGTSVDKGDALLVLEVMEMQVSILSENRGRAVSIRCLNREFDAPMPPPCRVRS